MSAGHHATRLRQRLTLGLLGVALLVLAGCASRFGGYYKDDGPGNDIPADIASIPDAVPRIEQHAPANFRPYEVFGVRYVPIAEDQAYRQEGVASWYGRKFHGEKTANGETYDMYAMTAAHPTLPIPSYARVTRVDTGRSVVVRINDRGPFHPGRIIDLSYVAAAKLGLIGPGSGRVIVQAITNADIRAGRYPAAPLHVGQDVGHALLDGRIGVGGPVQAGCEISLESGRSGGQTGGSSYEFHSTSLAIRRMQTRR